MIKKHKGNTNHKEGCLCCFCKSARGEQISHKKNLSYIQIYGKEKAEKIRLKLISAHTGVPLSKKHKLSLSALAQRRKAKQNGKMNKPEAIEKMRQAAILQFQDPLQRELRRNIRIREMTKQKSKGTLIEEKVKTILLKNNIHFEDQYEFEHKYVCDFAILDSKLIIECDGCWYHGCTQCCKKVKENNNPEYQEKRDNFIKTNNWRIIHFWGHEINKNIEEVENKILSLI